jgi:Tfp pilus assembly protein PilN
MIRINLLGVAKPAGKISEPSAGMAPEAIILPGALLVVLALITVFIYWYLNNDITKLTLAKQQQEAEQKRLAGIKEQNARYEQQLNQLELRLNTIHTLQASRVGPVELMTNLGKLVDQSNELYLITVKPTGDRLALEGQANSSDAIANFIGALQQSGAFDDVQLKQSYQDNQHDRVSFKFMLDCIYRQSGLPPPPASGQRAGGQGTS